MHGLLVDDSSSDDDSSSSEEEKPAPSKKRKASPSDTARVDPATIKKPKVTEQQQQQQQSSALASPATKKDKKLRARFAQEQEQENKNIEEEKVAEEPPHVPSNIHPSRLAQMNGDQAKEQKQKTVNAAAATNGKGKRAANTPFRRVREEDVQLDTRFGDNSFAAKVRSSHDLMRLYVDSQDLLALQPGSQLDYGAKASADLLVTRGDGFRKVSAQAYSFRVFVSLLNHLSDYRRKTRRSAAATKGKRNYRLCSTESTLRRLYRGEITMISNSIKFDD